MDDTEERLVSAVALQYTQKMILNLTNDVIKFKYASLIIKKTNDKFSVCRF